MNETNRGVRVAAQSKPIPAQKDLHDEFAELWFGMADAVLLTYPKIVNRLRRSELRP